VGYGPKKLENYGLHYSFQERESVFFFSEKGVVSNFFFFEKGAVDQKRLGTFSLDNRFTDSGKFVSPTHRPHFTPQEHCFFCFWYSFLLKAE
jgi:hypothetical protein